MKKRLSPTARVNIKQALTLVRKHVRGFEVSDGFDLRSLDHWPIGNFRRLSTMAARVREVTTTPYDIVKARTKKARKSLIQFTGKPIRRAKHFIVHKPTDKFKVKIRKGNVVLEGRLNSRVVSMSEYHLFPRRPRYPKELVTMARKMMKEMRPGFYTVLTAAHGDTGEPFEREQLLERLNEYLAAYEVDQEGNPTGFSEALLGFRFMATTLDGAVVQRRQIDHRRQRQKELNVKKRRRLLKAEQKRVKKRKKKVAKKKTSKKSARKK